MNDVQLKDLAEYQECCLRTSKYQHLVYDPSLQHYPADHARLCIAGLGLAGEIGEVAHLLSEEKNLNKDHNLDSMLEELGDVAYYVAELASACGIDLRTVKQNFPWCGLSHYPKMHHEGICLSKYVTLASLTAASGTLLDWIKKHVGHSYPFNQAFVHSQLWSLLNTLDSFCYFYGWSLQTVASRNISKLLLRHPKGYNTEYYVKKESQ